MVSTCFPIGGVLGVFDIEDLVEVLKRENAQDIFVASMPPEIKYCDYICVATSKSKRHMAAIMQFVRRVYKKKRNSSDLVPTTEGKGGSDWMALDLGRQFRLCKKGRKKVEVSGCFR